MPFLNPLETRARLPTVASTIFLKNSDARLLTSKPWCSGIWVEPPGQEFAFTRNPSTGANQFYGEFLINAQGEDVVAGIRTPLPVAELRNILPDVYNELVDIGLRLEKHYTDMQDVEFTIQDSKLYMLQTRNGKRTGQAAVRIAVEIVQEGLIDKQTALTRVPANDLDQLLHPRH